MYSYDYQGFDQAPLQMPPLTLPRPRVFPGGPQPPRARPPLITGGQQLSIRPNETIEGFQPNDANLNAAQIERLNLTAEIIARTHTEASPISIRVFGYMGVRDSLPNIGRRRAIAVRDALMTALRRQRRDLAMRLRWTIDDGGLSTPARVDIYISAGITPPPLPPVRRSLPLLPSTGPGGGGPPFPPRNIDLLLNQLPATPRRSFSEMFWQRVDQGLSSLMRDLKVPEFLREPIRRGVHEAITRGSAAILNQVIGLTELPLDVQQVLRGSTIGLIHTPITR